MKILQDLEIRPHERYANDFLEGFRLNVNLITNNNIMLI